MTKREKAEQKYAAISQLREMLQPGDTVYTILRHVSRSGMQRAISLFITAKEGGEPLNISYLAARAMDDRLEEKWDGIKICGCGMDMGFALVYKLAATLYPEGFGCTGMQEYPNRCPSNDHSNGDQDYTLGHWHQSGGYALRHRWL